jgi:hypothetical protein
MESAVIKESFSHAVLYCRVKPKSAFRFTVSTQARTKASSGKPGIKSPIIDLWNRAAFRSGRKIAKPPFFWGSAFNPSKHARPYWEL